MILVAISDKKPENFQALTEGFKLNFSKSCLLATFHCEMVAIKKLCLPFFSNLLVHHVATFVKILATKYIFHPPW